MLPAYIVESFEEIPQNESKEQYYGPWNSVLIHFFDIAKGYTIYPLYPPCGPFIPGESDPREAPISFMVKHNQADIFFVDVRAQNSIGNMAYRQDVDALMRTRFIQLYEASASHGITGVSAFGSQCAIYTFDKTTSVISPPSTIDSSQPDRIFDAAPKTMWDLDICTEEGYARFSEIVGIVKGKSQPAELDAPRRQ